jgi:hypothetical protein
MRRILLAMVLGGGLGAVPACEAADKPGNPTTPSRDQSIRRCETAGQIRTMPACTATVVERSPCSVQLRTADGRVIAIGSPGASKEVAAFVGTLKVGQEYRFPDAFVDHQKAGGAPTSRPRR